MSGVLLVHDYDAEELAISVGLVSFAQVRGGFAVRATTSRNELLHWIADHGRLFPGSPCIALVDLWADKGNPEHFHLKGLRIIETIRRHPALWPAAHAVAFTRYGRKEVLEQVRLVHASAVIHKLALASPSFDLVPWLKELEGRRPVPWADRREMLMIPPEADIAACEDPAAVFAEIFPGLPHKKELVATLREVWMGTNPETAGRRIVKAPRTVQEEYISKKLKVHVHARFVRGDGEVALHDAAREFFARTRVVPAEDGLPHYAMDGLAADLDRVAPPQRIVNLWHDVACRSDAWLDPEAERTLERNLAAGGSTWRERIANSSEEEDRTARKMRERELTRAVDALIDADADHLHHKG